MNAFQGAILGIIQGLTEFLPVSSSGHLVIFQHIFGLKQPELFFDVSVHMGTLAAIMVLFWRDIQKIIIAVFRFLKKPSVGIENDPDLKFAFLIIVGSVPTAIIGLLFHEIKDKIFSSITLVGIMLLITGLILLATRWIKKEGKGVASFSMTNAIIIGVVQGFAILPGISRSGSTISAALFLGIDRATAAKYSFLLSIPAIIGAELLSLREIAFDSILAFKTVFIGTAISFFVGYFALVLLMRIVNKGRLYIFAPYCFIIGIVTLFFSAA